MASTQSLIVKAKEFQPDKVEYDEPTTNKRGGKNVNLRLNGQPVVLQIPLMLTWGVNEWVDDGNGSVKYDMSLQFDPDKSSSQLAFLNAMKNLQTKILDDAVKNAKKWFGKKMSKEVVTALMYPILKYRKYKDGPNAGEPDLESNPTMKLKLPYWEGRYNVQIYDMSRDPLYLPPKWGCGAEGNKAPGANSESTPRDFVPKASTVKGLIRCNGLWFAGGKCGCSWQLMQLNVRPPARLVGSGKCYVMDDSDDDEDHNFDQAKSNDNFTMPVEEDDGKVTSDEEEGDGDEEDETEVKPPTPKKKKKKVVRRKKKSSS